MSEMQVIRCDGQEMTLSSDALEGLRGRLGGEVALPGAQGYEEARSLWHGMIDKRPGLIARCRGAQDVCDAVRFARKHDLLLSVRGGGHNIAGTAACDGGLMIDLSPMRAVRLEPGTNRVLVQPGCVWAEVDRETLPHGLAVPSGIISTTGVSGLTLGGGFGWLTRKYGLTCDSLRAVDLVTAEGRLVRASAEENPELFWGLRGGGGNFGIVTAFEFEAKAHGPEALCGLVLHRFERVGEVIRYFQEMTDDAPEELTSLLVVRTAPPKPFLPKEIHGKLVAGIGVNYAGPPEEGAKLLEPLRKFGEPVGDVIGVKPFAAHQKMLDAGQPHGRRYYWKSEYLGAVTAELAEVIERHMAVLPSPHSATLCMHLGGEAARVSEEESAAGHRDAPYVINLAGAWDEAESDEPGTAWVRRYHEKVKPHSTGGVYVNFLTAEEGAERVRASYSAGVYERLVALKKVWDPENVFRLNKNIDPDGG